MKYAWIAKHKAHWPITLACVTLGVSASGYFEHLSQEKHRQTQSAWFGQTAQ